MTSTLAVASARLTDRRFGPILGTQRQRLGGLEPRWWLATTQLARHPIGNPFANDTAAGAGTALDADEATDRSIGEALERYSALQWVPELSLSTLREGGFLDRWPRCAADEAAPPSLKELPADVPVPSVAAHDVYSGETRFIPAAHVLLQYTPAQSEPVVALSISTGLAFHPDRATAIWSALCEVIERDAVMSGWWAHTSHNEIDADSAPHAVQERLARLEERQMRARLFSFTSELGVPTVFAILTSPTFPHLVVGAATKARAEDACTKALDELVSMRVALTSRPQPSQVSPSERGVPMTLVDHALAYAGPDHQPAFDFLTDTETVSFEELNADSFTPPADMASLAATVRQLEEKDVSVLWVDMTAPEVNGLGTVAKVVIPELLPLSPRDDVRWLATPRLLTRAVAARVPTFTSYPHPFA